MRYGIVSCIAASLALAGAATVATTSAATAASRHLGERPADGLVELGGAPLLPRGAVRLGALDPDTTLRLEVVLRPRDPAALARLASEVSTPGSPLFHHYLAPGAFPERFGPSAAAIATVESSLRAAGLHPGAISDDHLLLPVTATAGELARAFSIGFEHVRIGKRSVFANTSAPRLPAAAARDLTGIVGLDNLSVPHPESLLPTRSDAAGPTPSRGASGLTADSRRPAVAEGGIEKCAGASGVGEGSLTAQQLATAYDFDPLYGADDFGSGITVGVFELETNRPSDITAFQKCYGTDATVKYLPEDGGASDVGDQDPGLETDLDIEQVIGLAPEATIDVYQGPNSDDDSGPLATYDAMIGSPANGFPQVISTSWGECELALTQTGGTSGGNPAIAAENLLFEEAATDGQSVFAAAGDSGSADCSDYNGSDSPAVDDPASQPFVTGAGGTTTTSVDPLTQSAWSDSGGGISSSWDMPGYQSSAASSLHVVSSASSGTPCGANSGTYCREVPDVSADADPDTGVAVYWTEAGEDGSGPGWLPVGGTSAAAPAWAAVTAELDADAACAGSLVGFANTTLYDVAGSSYASAFHDVTSGSNGAFDAGSGYDMVTGLGTPDVSGLATALCPSSATAPGAPTSVVAAEGSTTVPGDGQVHLSWTAPSDDGGATIRAYDITPTPACPSCTGLSTSGGATSTTIARLTPGARYSFSVTAINDAATGTAGSSGPITVYTVPSAPRSVAASMSLAGVATVGFAAPLAAGGEVVRDYEVAPSPACAHCSGTVTTRNPATISGLAPGTSYRFAVRAVNAAGAGPPSTASPTVLVPPRDGYWLATRDGAVLAAGSARQLAGTSASATDPVVGIVATVDGRGYLLVTAHGGVAALGDAKSLGDLASRGIARTDIVSIVATAGDGGYWLVGSDGEVYPFGDAAFHGDLLSLAKPVHVSDIVGMVASANGAGYLLVGADGGVFAFGRAQYHGSLPGLGIHVHDIRGILPSATGEGYVLVGADGGAFVFGTGTKYYGSLPGRHISVSDIVGLAITSDGDGYYMVGSNGAVYGFGDATVYATPAGLSHDLPVTAIAEV